jgi:mannose/fructose-specific phosphotransferase system component IIA
MSSGEVQGILVAHGKMADGLLDAVREISGLTDGLVAVDNLGLTPDALEERLDGLTGEQPSVVFVDLPSGSCAFVARRLRGRRANVAVVCGVNLPLLLDFVFHRTLPLDEILARLRTHTGISIEQAKHDDTTLPDR